MVNASHRLLLRSLGIAALTLTLLAGCSKPKTAEEYISDAKADMKSGKVPAAIIALRNALQKSPTNAAARVQLAEAYIVMLDAVSAEAELTSAKQDGAQQSAIAKPLAEAELLQGDPEKVLSNTTIDDHFSAPLKASLLSERAKAQMRLGRLDDAHETLIAALSADANSSDALSTMAEYDLAQGNVEAAEGHLAAAQQKAPNDPDLLMLQGIVAIAKRDFASAEQAFQQVLKVEAWNSLVRARLARVEIAEQKFKEADADLAIVLKTSPKSPLANYLRALSDFEAKDYKSALSYSQNALGFAKDYAPALKIAGAASYALNQLEQADSLLSHYGFLVPDDVPARKLLATVEMRLGRNQEAVKTLTPAIAKSDGKSESDAELLALMGTATARSGDLLEATEYFKRAVKSQPENPRLRAELGITQVSAGETDAGIDELEKASEQDPNAVAPEVALIRSYLAAKQYDKALELAHRLETGHPSDLLGFDITGLIYAIEGQNDKAEAEFLKARALKPGDFATLHNLAALAIKANKLDLATNYYNEVLKANPKDTRAYMALADIAMRAAKPQEAETELKKALEIKPDDVNPRVGLGRLYLSEGKARDALNIVQPALAKDPHNVGVLDALGQAQLASGSADQALTSFRTWAELEPKSPAPHLLMADAYLTMGNLDAALAERKEAVSLDPKNVAMNLDLAQLLVNKGNSDAALQIVDDLLKDNPNDARVHEMDGLIAMAQDRIGDAVNAFQVAVHLQDNSLYRSRLAAAQATSGHPEEAEKTLQPLIDANPKDINARLALVQIYTSANELDRASNQVEEILKLSPDNPAARMAKARILMAKNDLTGAQSVIEGMEKDYPRSDEAAQMAGLIALREKHGDEAITDFQHAMKLHDSSEIRIRLAAAEADSGHADEAEKTLVSWIDDHKDDLRARMTLAGIYLSAKQLEDAEAQYAEIVRQAPDNVVAENNLAWTLAQRDKNREALTHARHAAALAPNAPAVLDTLGMVLLQNRDTSEALQTLQKASTLAPKNPGIQFHLARALASSGDKEKARDLLNQLIASGQTFQERPEAVAFLKELGG